jgi:hypothetical protein
MFGNERDVEVPALLRFVDEIQPKSLLDVGAHFSAHTYATEIRKRMPKSEGAAYWAIDLSADPETAAIVDCYRIGDVTGDAHRQVLDTFGGFDVVSCVSVIEHAREKFGGSMDMLMARLAMLTRRGLFVSFPFGKEGKVPNEYENVTDATLKEFCELLDHAKLDPSVEFIVSDSPQLGRAGWYWTTWRHAEQIPLEASRGVRCVCMLTARRRE